CTGRVLRFAAGTWAGFRAGPTWACGNKEGGRDVSADCPEPCSWRPRCTGGGVRYLVERRSQLSRLAAATPMSGSDSGRSAVMADKVQDQVFGVLQRDPYLGSWLGEIEFQPKLPVQIILWLFDDGRVANLQKEHDTFSWIGANQDSILETV